MSLDDESRLTLKLLSEGRISAKSADRILRALVNSSKNNVKSGVDYSPVLSLAVHNESPESTTTPSEKIPESDSKQTPAEEMAQEDPYNAVPDQQKMEETGSGNDREAEKNEKPATIPEERRKHAYSVVKNRSPRPRIYRSRSRYPISICLVSIVAFVFIILTVISTHAVSSYIYGSKVKKIQYNYSISSLEHSYKMKSLKEEMQNYQDLISGISRKGRRKSLGFFEVTAYDPVESCKPFDDGITSVGLPVGMGIAAVDPKVIPYGSILYIPELGRYFFASDTGSAMKHGNGKNIDILMPTVEEALEFGRKRLRVELIDLAKG